MMKQLITLISAILLMTSLLTVTEVVEAREMGHIDEGSLKALAKKPKQDYQVFYTMDPETLDYLYTFKQIDSRHFANFIDGLLEHDAYGNLVPCLAVEWYSNEEKTVWTFKLRQGTHWYTDEGGVYAEVTAHDFVTGLQHAADFQSQTLYLVKDVIKNLSAYTEGKVGFDQVGVKAIDDYTLEYTLNDPTPYFPSMTTYSILLPVNQGFLESKGKGCRLGNPDYGDCQFGSLNPESILYNGPYLLTNLTSKSVIEYRANPAYWDFEAIHIPNVKMIYCQNVDPTTLFLAFERGEIISAPIDVYNAAIFKSAKQKYGDSIYVTESNSATSFATFVFNRQQYHSPLDERIDCSPKTAKQREDTKQAILNPTFRQAILRALDISIVNAQSVGEELKDVSLRNLLTQPDFVSTSQSEPYSMLVEEYLKQTYPDFYDASLNLEDGQMAYYNPKLAQDLMKQAKEELMTAGVDFPIYLDVQVNGESEMGFRSAQALKQSLETELAGDVKVNLIVSSLEHMVAAKNANLLNTDLYFAAAWSPDYGDPKSYLDILDPEGGDMLKYFGLQSTQEDQLIKEQIGLNEFKRLKDEAASIVDDSDSRYSAYAKAEAYALHQAYFIPLSTSGGNYAISKIIPYTKPYSPYGLSGMKLKGMQISHHIVSIEERDRYKEEWLKQRHLLK